MLVWCKKIGCFESFYNLQALASIAGSCKYFYDDALQVLISCRITKASWLSLANTKHHFVINTIVCVLMLTITHKLPAQVSDPQGSTELQNNAYDNYDNIEINGLLVDETITKVGRDFYELFYQQWNAPKSSMNYTLFIKERPMMGLGSEVVVVLNDTEIFKRRIQPRYSMIEAVTNYAVAYTKQYILNYESIVQQLGSQDQQGTGIY